MKSRKGKSVLMNKQGIEYVGRVHLGQEYLLWSALK